MMSVVAGAGRPRSYGLRVLVVLALLAVAAVVAALVLRTPPVPLADLEERYRLPESRFLDVDGVRLHYLDEGEGPAVILLHASFMNLRTWDGLAAALRERFRVIRPDLLIAGLTGPEPRGDYRMERNVELVEGLGRALGVDRFSVVGTSSGGIVAFELAARHPERVERLVLINSAGMPRTAATDPNRPRGNALTRWAEANLVTRQSVRDILARNFTPPHTPPDWLVDMNQEFWRREGRAAEGELQRAQFRTGDPEAVLARITAPTLILWGIENATVMHLEADVFEHWLVNAPVLKKKYPGAGHYLYLEIPDEVHRDVGDFLSGALDARLRRVTVHTGAP